jgi:hypothetical protein
MKYFLLTLLLLINSTIFSKEINILFVTSGPETFDKTEVVNSFTAELSKLRPLDAYAEFINFFSTDDDKFNGALKFTSFNTFKLDSKIFLKASESYKIMDLYILIIKNDVSKGSGGSVGKDKIPVILITSASKKGIITHEFAHSILGLGDEYGGDLGFPPSEKEMTGIKNLILKDFNEEWETIKKMTSNNKISYYEGGMGRNKGIFHSYPECLMNKIEFPLCPVCLYYSIIKLNNITGSKIDFTQYIRQDMKAKKSLVPIIKHLQ